MSDQVWPWQDYLNPLEAANQRALDKQIRALDQRRPGLVKELAALKSKVRAIEIKAKAIAALIKDDDVTRKALADQRLVLVCRGRHRAKQAAGSSSGNTERARV